MKRANDSAMGKRNGGFMISPQGSERALLAFLLAKLQELDADVYTGHNISAFDMDILMHRLQHHKATSLHPFQFFRTDPCRPYLTGTAKDQALVTAVIDA